MPTRLYPPLLPDSTATLGDQLRVHFRRLAKAIAPKLPAIERKFGGFLRKSLRDPRQQAAVNRITTGAAARHFLTKKRPFQFFEEVAMAGQALAKLNVSPSTVVELLNSYDELLTPVYASVDKEALGSVQLARQQLLFCVILTLNEAYYHVREFETQTFHDVFRLEVEVKNIDELYRRYVEVMADAYRAAAAHLFLLEPDESEWVLRGSTAKGVTPALASPLKNSRKLQHTLANPLLIKGKSGAFLDRGWPGEFPYGWSFPIYAHDRLAGVLQFGFREPVEWFPRDAELISATADRCWIAAERGRLLESLAAREAQIRNVAEHMLHVEEMERRRISRELHDEAGQSLVCIRLQMELIEMALPAGSVELAAKLGDVRDITEKTILDMRRLIADLSPVVLEQFGLDAALRQLVKRLQTVHACTVHLNTKDLDKLPQKLQIIVYRIVQECCNNVGKHSNASNVNISVTSADGVLRLQVKDNGCGFDVEGAFKKSDSFGLSGIRERVALLGGRFEISSQESSKSVRSKKNGSTVTIELPLAAGTSW